MAFDGTRPADNQTIAAGPGDIRENLRALKEDKIVNAQKVMDLSPGNASGNIPVANGTLCTNLNVEKLGGNLASAFAAAGHTHGVVTTSSNGLMSNTDKAKLDGIAAGAEVNQNVFSNVLVGTTTIVADGKTDTLELAAGANITLTPDATNDRVTMAVSGTVPNANEAVTATKLVTPRTINLTGGVTGGASFDGSGNVSIPAVITGNAPTATQLAKARNINGVPFDGSADISITAPANGGTSAACSGNSATASKLITPRTISLTGIVEGNVTFDGSGNVLIMTTGGAPVGMIAPFAMSVVPDGWLECNGQTVSRSRYASLFGAIGTIYGTGDGSATFNLPDLRGEFVRGWDHGRGVDKERSLGSLESDDFKSHYHHIGSRSYGGSTSSDSGYSMSSGSYGSCYTASTGGTETRPRNVALMYCIKY